MSIRYGEHDGLGEPRLLSKEEFIRVALCLQIEGWRIALKKDATLTRDRDELYMNRQLYLGMKYVRRAMGLFNVYILEMPTVRSTLSKHDLVGEPDIALIFSGIDANDPHALIECKRLDPCELPPRLRGKYVREGIDRFIDGLYGHEHEVDFMIAYVLRGDESAAMQDVNSYLQNVGREHDILSASSHTGSKGFVATSEHLKEIDVSRFRLFHTFLRF